MRLVEYASSDSENDTELPPPSKRRRLSSPRDAAPPPLPAAFHDLYAGAARIGHTDDRSLHGGRVRLVPHVEGNWAAHVYLEWHPTLEQHAHLTKLIDALSADYDGLTTFLSSPNGVPQPLHISLSAPLILRTETKDDFRASVIAGISRAAKSLPEVTAAGKVIVVPAGLGWHPNAERTRGFLVFPLQVGAQDDGRALGKLLGACNDVAARFGCNRLYATSSVGDGAVKDAHEVAEDKFHISIAWALDPEMFPAGPVRVPVSVRRAETRLKEIRIDFHDIKVKIGKDVVSVPLGQARGGGTGSCKW
ncbi:hypothetical protein K461DRAFT_319288 [Myriangium duriaei CBS 260.36]|uniref:U6 snRNA phosphodiesterase 1 n=1 Tax=Myriangium duriaei CBS 260.36 TaxID=1168546 RepID=A0A9P4MJ14_9PEZI|nr:hypothetical protein K461DRAFT_319288 [Myriangium duriaei CBS 260.36]